MASNVPKPRSVQALHSHFTNKKTEATAKDGCRAIASREKLDLSSWLHQPWTHPSKTVRLQERLLLPAMSSERVLPPLTLSFPVCEQGY